MRHRTVSIAICGILSAILLHAADADAPRPEKAATLTGAWAGQWTDSRPNYSGSGGAFTGKAAETEPGRWQASFKVGSTRSFDVKLQGRLVDGKLVFAGAVDLGSVQGVYTWSGRVAGDQFTGEYDGPDEKGTFKMMRVKDDKAAK